MKNTYTEKILVDLSDKYKLVKKNVLDQIKIPYINNNQLLEVTQLCVNNKIYYIDSNNNIYNSYMIINKNMLIGNKIGYALDNKITINKIE